MRLGRDPDMTREWQWYMRRDDDWCFTCVGVRLHITVYSTVYLCRLLRRKKMKIILNSKTGVWQGRGRGVAGANQSLAVDELMKRDT